MPFNKITAETLTDHAGGFYGWFEEVEELADGGLKLTSNPEYTNETPVTKVVTPSKLKAATEAARKEASKGSYEHEFYSTLLFGDLDDADGDMNAVDVVLQIALWGEVVFG